MEDDVKNDGDGNPPQKVPRRFRNSTQFKIIVIIFFSTIIVSAVVTMLGISLPDIVIMIIFLVCTFWLSLLIVDPFLRKIDTLNSSWLRGALKGFALTSVLPVWWILFLLIQFGIDSGSWRCLICNNVISRTDYWGIPVSQERSECLYIKKSKGYEQWYWENIAIEHNHEWSPIGCHFSLRMIACSFGGTGELFYSAIPHVPDKDIAISMARRVATASPNERVKLLESLRKGSDAESEVVFWKSLYDGGTVSRDDFIKFYKAWLPKHPEWQ